MFSIVQGANGYGDAFWDTNKSWNNVFSAAGLTALNTLFTTFNGSGLTPTGTAIATASGEGQFRFSGTTLQWTAVPEPDHLARLPADRCGPVAPSQGLSEVDHSTSSAALRMASCSIGAAG